jgi:hypothetical protein
VVTAVVVVVNVFGECKYQCFCNCYKGGRGYGCGLEFGEDETDAADDVVGGSFVGGKGKKLDGEVA